MKCAICKRKLDDPKDPTTRNCGGDCLKCMAEAGDPDCIKSMNEIQDPIKISETKETLRRRLACFFWIHSFRPISSTMMECPYCGKQRKRNPTG